VLEVYEILPEELFFIDEYMGNVKYGLSYNNGKYSSVSLAEYSFDVIVDIKNGYIEISDEGTGGGSIYQQIVLFRSENREPLIGITIGGFNSFYFETRLNFYRYINKRWQMVTTEVLPDIKLERFVNNEFYRLNKEKFHDNASLFEYIYELPQFGTQVKIRINFMKIKSLLYDKIDFQSGTELTEDQTDFLIDFTGNIKYSEVKLDFNRQAVKFNVAEYIPVKLETVEDVLFTYLETVDNGEVFDPEADIISLVYDLPEMMVLGKYIDENSDHQNNLKIITSYMKTS
jgi:hypothetical protein